jgi:hypothetical protein
LTISLGSLQVAQIWQCGCGLLAPIIAPRFSKICTARMLSCASSLMNSSRQSATTLAMSSTLMRASVRSCRGEKQTTRQTPDSPSATSRPDSFMPSVAAIGCSAAKSLSKAKTSA